MGLSAHEELKLMSLRQRVEKLQLDDKWRERFERQADLVIRDLHEHEIEMAWGWMETIVRVFENEQEPGGGA